MRLRYALIATLLSLSAAIQTQQGPSTSLFGPQTQNPFTPTPKSHDLLTPSAAGPDVPLNVPSFNVGFFSAQEQFHDLQIADLTTRLATLEGRANFLSGTIYALGLLLLLIGVALKMFWRGIVQAILAQNRILHG